MFSSLNSRVKATIKKPSSMYPSLWFPTAQSSGCGSTQRLNRNTNRSTNAVYASNMCCTRSKLAACEHRCLPRLSRVGSAAPSTCILSCTARLHRLSTLTAPQTVSQASHAMAQLQLTIGRQVPQPQQALSTPLRRPPEADRSVRDGRVSHPRPPWEQSVRYGRVSPPPIIPPGARQRLWRP